MRYKLRTLLIVVTVTCTFLGYEWEWIRARRSFIESTKASANNYSSEYGPAFLWVFGEHGIDELYLPVDQSETEVKGFKLNRSHAKYQRAASLFPEATVVPFIQHSP